MGSWIGGCTLFLRAAEFSVADSKSDHAHRGARRAPFGDGLIKLSFGLDRGGCVLRRPNSRTFQTER